MSGSEESGRERYMHPRMHLCKECGGELEKGDQVVCLSDGYVDTDASYAVDNRRFFHAGCWKNSDYMDTDS